jgi:DNA-binding response OmpR family regulator
MGRILIVEDHDDEREGLQDLLDLDGHQVEVCATADEAQRFFATFAPDGAVIDIGLPDSHGVELAYRLKRQAPELCVVVVSGYLKKWDPEDIRDCGADLVLEKPYNSARLLAAFSKNRPVDGQAVEAEGESRC